MVTANVVITIVIVMINGSDYGNGNGEVLRVMMAMMVESEVMIVIMRRCSMAVLMIMMIELTRDSSDSDNYCAGRIDYGHARVIGMVISLVVQ